MNEIEPEKSLLDGTLNFDVEEMKAYGVDFVMMRMPNGVIRELPRAFIDVELQAPVKRTIHRVYWSRVDGMGHAVPYADFLQIEREKKQKLKE